MTEGFEPFPYPLSEGRASTHSFRLINQTVMTRAEAPTVDSWVHLAQTLRPPLWGVTFFLLATVGAAWATIFAGLQVFGFIPVVNPDAGFGLVLGMILVGLIAVACGWISWLLIGRSIRNGTVGARPSGVALGEHGVIVRVPGRDVEIPWEGIHSVGARSSVAGEHRARDTRGSQAGLPIIELVRDPEGPFSEQLQLIVANGYRVPGDALYTALRWYHAHPEVRWELGRIEGERRLEGWREATLGMR